MKQPELNPRKAPSQKRGRIRVGQILDVTEKLVLEIGYDSITTNVIAERAGIPIGTLYHYYSNKFAIYADIVKRAFSELEQHWQDQPRADPESESIEEYFDRIIEMMAQHWKQRKAAMSLWSLLQHTPEMQPISQRFLKIATARNAETISHYYPQIAPARRKLVGLVVEEVGSALLNRLNSYKGKQRELFKAEMKLLIRSYLSAMVN